MKILFAAFALGFGMQLTALAHEDLTVFSTKVKWMDCSDERPIGKLSGTCLFTFQAGDPAGAELIGLVIHSDLYWDGGKFIRVGDVVRVDLGYTTKQTTELRSYFSKNISRIYFHDNITSLGSYSDVISRERRE